MGLLDWLTDGSLGSMGMGDPTTATGLANTPPSPGMPPVQQTGSDGPPLAPPQPNPGAMAPPVDPSTQAMPGGTGAGPAPPPPDPTPAAGPPDPPVGGAQLPVPLPAPRPPGADAAPPAPTPAASAPPPAPPGPPVSLAPPGNGTNGVGPGLGVGTQPYHLGDQTALGRALGIDPKSKDFNTALTGLGSGLTAAGNSKGKSPFQAFASGAGASIEGAAKEGHSLEKDNIAYLSAAISAQKAGDSATAQTNLAAYQKGKLLLEQQKAATDKATPSKNDSPQQLFLASQRNVAADPLVKGAMANYNNALKNGNGPTDPNVVAAKAAYDQTVQQQTAVHLAGVGLHPQTAAQIAQQPGMTQANPVNAGQAGITPANISKKLQPGQFYTNPADGKVYQYKGEPSSKSSATSSTKKDDDDDADTPAADPKKKAADEDDD